MSILEVMEKSKVILRFMVILFFMAATYYFVCRPVIEERILKEKVRRDQLNSYLEAQEEYALKRVIKSAFKESVLLCDEEFIKATEELRKKIDTEKTGEISDEDIDKILKKIEVYQKYILDVNENAGMSECFQELREGYLTEYRYCVENIIRNEHTSIHREIEVVEEHIRVLIQVIEEGEVSEDDKLLYLRQLDKIEEIIKEMIEKRAVHESMVRKKLQQIGEIEGIVSYLELFRTLPLVASKETHEFKHRIFRLHLTNKLEEFGKHWSIVFGHRLGSDSNNPYKKTSFMI